MILRDLARRIISLTRSRSRLTFRPLPVDDPKVRQPDISLARKVWSGNRRSISTWASGARSDTSANDGMHRDARVSNQREGVAPQWRKSLECPAGRKENGALVARAEAMA